MGTRMKQSNLTGLMRNHFHLLVRIKSEENIGVIQTPEGRKDSSGLGNNLSVSNRPESVLKKKYKPSNQFSHLFNAYTKAINKRHHRSGSLFEHPFRRIQVNSIEHLKYLIYYIHHNPIHHEFCEHFLDYPWSSYLTIVSPRATKLSRSEVLAWYKDKSNFIRFHSDEKTKQFEQLNIDFIGDG